MNIARKKVLVWVKAARPQTLPAAFVPVFIGSLLALDHRVFDLTASITALLCALLIQIGTNFANDYFDFIKGADTEDRIGFERATATGQITSREMLFATLIFMGTAFILGLYLVWVAGWPILVIGIASLMCGIAYTGGPFPLGYRGLGDLFVFLFFGIIAVMGTYYVNALEWSVQSFWASLSIGALSTNILVVNNLRDIQQDRAAGKKTLGVIFGESALMWEYLFMLLLSLLIPIYFYWHFNYDWVVLLPLFSFPWGTYLCYKIWSIKDKRLLNNMLERTGQFMTLYGILFGIGILTG